MRCLLRVGIVLAVLSQLRLLILLLLLALALLQAEFIGLPPIARLQLCWAIFYRCGLWFLAQVIRLTLSWRLCICPALAGGSVLVELRHLFLAHFTKRSIFGRTGDGRVVFLDRLLGFGVGILGLIVPNRAVVCDGLSFWRCFYVLTDHGINFFLLQFLEPRRFWRWLQNRHICHLMLLLQLAVAVSLMALRPAIRFRLVILARLICLLLSLVLEYLARLIFGLFLGVVRQHVLHRSRCHRLCLNRLLGD